MSRETDLYKKNLIYSATKGELLIILYNETIKNLNQIITCINNKDYEKSNILANKTEKIFIYLIQTLDFNYKISEDLEGLYNYFNKEIFKAIRNNSTKTIEEILGLVKELRDSWREADKIAKRWKRYYKLIEG